MTGWLGTEYFIAACLALFIIDKYGRRALMIWGAVGLALSMLVIGTSLSFASETNKTPAIIATVFIFVYDTAFAIGWLGVTWVRLNIVAACDLVNPYVALSGRSYLDPYSISDEWS